MSNDSSSANSKVTSKYFNSPSTSKSTGMDESLSEFKEEKKSYKGPKKVKLQKKTTQKPKKRIRGQKDIRTALKPKKNDLLTYANDFDKVCKQSGIDVDSEQLQLAIALSMSLKTNVDVPSTNSQSRDRTGKIKKTLQEYGFKVPENEVVKRRVKRYRKDYKLLLTSTEEKQQVISDRYSEVLFTNIQSVSPNRHESTKLDLFFIATEISYDLIKNSNFFYIKNFVEQNANSVGSQLKNWSLIPGRPKSPIGKKTDVKLSDLKVTQDNLDIILSGTINSAQGTVKSLSKISPEKENLDIDICYKSVEKSINIETKMETDIIVSLENDENCEEQFSFMPLTEKDKLERPFKINHIDKSQPITMKNYQRCSSPDLFDDESVMEHAAECSDVISQDLKIITPEPSNNFMDLTDCVVAKLKQNVDRSQFSSQRNRKSHDFIDTINAEKSQKIISMNVERSLSSQKSQGNNITKRKTDDFMEITDCVAGSTQPLIENNEVNIDLTQSSDECKINTDLQIIPVNCTEVMDLTQDSYKTLTSKTNIGNSNKDLERLDLTQSSNSEDELPLVQISGQQANKDGSQVNKGYLEINKGGDQNEKDGRQFKEDDLQANEVGTQGNIDGGQVSKDSSLNDTIIVNDDKFKGLNNSPKNVSIGSKDKRNSACKSKSDSFFDEYNFVHSDEDIKRELSDYSKDSSSSSKNSKLSDIDCIEKLGKEKTLYQDIHNVIDMDSTSDSAYIKVKISREKILDIVNDIDLTQSSNDEEEYYHSHIDTSKSSQVACKSPQVTCKSFRVSCNIPKLSLESLEVSCVSPEVICKSPKATHDNLGKRNNVSIDYDEIFDDIIEQHNINSKQNSFNSKSITKKDKIDICESKKLERSDSIISSSSQNSEVFVISDNEFNYSVNQSRYERSEENYEIPEENYRMTQEDCENQEENYEIPEKTYRMSQENFEMPEKNYRISQEDCEMPKENFDFGGIAIMDNISNARSSKSIRKSEENNAEIRRNEEILNVDLNDTRNDSFLPIIDVGYTKRMIIPSENESILITINKDLSLPYNITSKANIIETPSNTKYILKTDQVTPMLDYESMTTPERNKELDRYGLKPFKRKRAIQLLTHLYNQTHPIVESCSENAPSPTKKQKPNTHEILKSSSQHSPKKIPTKTSPRKYLSQRSPKKSIGISPIKLDSNEASCNFLCTENSPGVSNKVSARKSPRKCLSRNVLRKSPKKNVQISPIKLVKTKEPNPNAGENSFCTSNGQNQLKSPRKRAAKSGQSSPKSDDNFEWPESEDLYEVTNEKPVIKAIDCDEEDWVFHKREKAKAQSCRVPLHIAFHNYASARPNLIEAILRYEPINIDYIHKGLLGNGFRFDPKDLLKFLDKKCITVKTADNDVNKKT